MSPPGALTSPSTTAVAAVASVPFSSTSIVAWWMTFVMYEVFVRRDAGEVRRRGRERERHPERGQDRREVLPAREAELRAAVRLT